MQFLLQLEQMELEVREVEASQRPRLRTRVDSYQAELRRLKQAFENACSTTYIDGNASGLLPQVELMFSPMYCSSTLFKLCCCFFFFRPR